MNNKNYHLTKRTVFRFAKTIHQQTRSTTDPTVTVFTTVTVSTNINR